MIGLLIINAKRVNILIIRIMSHSFSCSLNEHLLPSVKPHQSAYNLKRSRKENQRSKFNKLTKSPYLGKTSEDGESYNFNKTSANKYCFGAWTNGNKFRQT